MVVEQDNRTMYMYKSLWGQGGALAIPSMYSRLAGVWGAVRSYVCRDRRVDFPTLTIEPTREYISIQLSMLPDRLHRVCSVS